MATLWKPRVRFAGLIVMSVGIAALITSAPFAQDSTPQGQVTFTKDVAPILQKDRKSTRLNSSHIQKSRMPSSA